MNSSLSCRMIRPYIARSAAMGPPWRSYSGLGSERISKDSIRNAIEQQIDTDECADKPRSRLLLYVER